MHAPGRRASSIRPRRHPLSPGGRPPPLNEGIAYVGYNANYRTIELLGEGRPVPQQDNYLTKREL